jgi:hypothetical protein
LALLAVPGVLVAGITLLIDAYWKRHRRELAGDLGPYRLSDIADEAQRWLDAQA